MSDNAAIKIFVVDDDVTTSMIIKRSLDQLDQVNVTTFSCAEDFLAQIHENPDVVTLDYNLDGSNSTNGLDILKKVKNFNQFIKVVMMSGQTEVEVTVNAYKNGADDYIIKGVNAFVELTNSVKNLISGIQLSRQVEKLQAQIIDRNKYSNIIGNSAALLKVLRLIQKSENSNILVLVTGESGTGKESVANAVHYNSARKKKPFVEVNMAAISPDLTESELFGHEKGAFTGAYDRRIGKFEEADGGTIFLDEIGEMEPQLQAKLLRVMQESEIVRVGGNKTIKLDVRIVAATNKDLFAEVKAGKFREDLFYRLQGILIHLPPLRERGDDVLLLTKHFLKRYTEQNHLGDIEIERDVMHKIQNHTWPGNIRELKSVIERAALLCENRIITTEDLYFAG